jgi:predicted TIM-barrel fold metal-dependent hydrolase
LIDSLVFHDWPGTKSLTPYMTRGYREWFERPGDPFGALAMRTHWRYRDPREPRGDAKDFAALRAWLDDIATERVVLGYQDANLITASPNHYPVRALVRAANDWLAAERLAADPRLFGLIMISTSLPDEAAAEVRRVAENDRFVGISMGINALGRPFGDPLYHPIYRAASEAGLPIVIQVGSDATASTNSTPVGGGFPTTFAEVHAMAAESHMTHMASLITQGVFDLFPDLRVLLVGGGVTWVPGSAWRLDYWYKMYSREMPWLKALPSEYFCKYFRVATHELEKVPDPARFARALGSLPDMESMLVYASGFPSPDHESPSEIGARLPEAWHPKVFSKNAEALFRWPGSTRSGAATGLASDALLEMSTGSR